MSPNEAKDQIQALTAELRQHTYNYYVLAMPTISDYDFDKKLEELSKLLKSSSLNLPTLNRLHKWWVAISPRSL
jgi:NAD-dependent DNA ligase